MGDVDMDETRIHSGEILFVKSVKDGIPNRDPLRDSDTRRVFGGEDGRISLSDVSIKRDVRDYVQARYPDGGGGKSMFVFCREERVEGNRLLGREKLAGYSESTRWEFRHVSGEGIVCLW